MDVNMGKLIITKLNIHGIEMIFRGLHDEKRFYQIGFEPLNPSQNGVLGNIYVGRVKDIVKNINAAFIEYQKGSVGYYSLMENKSPIFLNAKTNTKPCQGDLMLIQIAKEAVKTKEPVLTSQISLPGKYIVLNFAKSGIGFSPKIKDIEFKKNVQTVLGKELQQISEESNLQFGLIIRTNAIQADIMTILAEFKQLRKRFYELLEEAKFRTAFSVMYQDEFNYLKMIRNAYEGEIEEIVTDDEDILKQIQSYLNQNGFEHMQNCVRFYNDSLLPLYKLYSLETFVKSISAKNVWLKSGAYLVIEHTEAMTVIDVNTGKCIKGKDLRQTVLSVNLEAAKEIAYQLRVRNISGIIMVDFINMEAEEDKQTLLQTFRSLLAKDNIKTTLVDITGLDIVEVTRKKTEPPIYEQIKGK